MGQLARGNRILFFLLISFGLPASGVGGFIGGALLAAFDGFVG